MDTIHNTALFIDTSTILGTSESLQNGLQSEIDRERQRCHSLGADIGSKQTLSAHLHQTPASML